MVIGEDNMPGTNKTTNPGEQRKTTGMRTVAKALQILGLFNHKSPEWTIKEVSHRLDLPYSTTYRYISTLVSAGYLVSHDRNGTYRVGLIAIELGGLALNQLDVRLHGLAYLDHLADTTQLNANLAVLYQADILHIAYAVHSTVPHYYTVIGRRSTAHCTALGKVLLAGLPFNEVRSLISKHGWRPQTPNSITQGYSVDRNEQALKSFCVGAPIHNRLGHVVAAVSVSGSGDPVPEERIPQLAQAVINTANMISYHLGYDSDYSLPPAG